MASRAFRRDDDAVRFFVRLGGLLALTAAALLPHRQAEAAISCARTLVADVVALDQPLMFNRLGAQNVNGMMFALRRDVLDESGKPLHQGGSAQPGRVALRPDKRPRPLVLRVAEGDCLKINLQNLLAGQANPRNAEEPELQVDDQVRGRQIGFKVNGLQAVGGIGDIAANSGRNGSTLLAPGATRSYTLYAEREGVFLATSDGATFGGEGAAGNVGNGLFAQVVVVPKGGRIYRNTVTEEELRLATTGRTPAGQPIINYEARYPDAEPWRREGKAGAPILNMIDGSQIVASHSDAIVMGPNEDGSFPASTYPLERIGRRNPALPNRLEPFRDFAVAFQDEAVAAQAFPGYWSDPVFGHVLEPARDAFMINYGANGVGAEVLANRLGVGPMHDCLGCQYEEFFLSSHAVGDAAMLVDVPANVGLESLRSGQTPPANATGIKAGMALYPAEPSNVSHSYIGDFVKFRNTHAGHEQHVFHLHGHQWLYNPNDDNSDYVDAQGIGPGAGYTYEIAFGGSGNRNRVAGDAIFHCHFYPHFAQGMWSMWRTHDVFEEGTRLEVSEEGRNGFHDEPFELRSGLPAEGARALPDGEIVAGTPIPGKVRVVAKIGHGPSDDDDDDEGRVVGSVARVDRGEANRNADGTLKNPGFPFWIAGLEDSVGQRPPTPPLDMLDRAKAQALRDSGKALWANIDPAQAGGWSGGLPRGTLDGWSAGGEAHVITSALDFSKTVEKARPIYFPEEGTEVEQAAMAFHAKGEYASYAVLPGGTVQQKNFRTNGALPVAGAPFFEPCMDDRQMRLTASAGSGRFFGASGLSFSGSSTFTADRPRVYKGANIQFDAVFNKVGYHFPQARILTLWEDAVPTIDKRKPPEPLVMRMNTFDCTMYHHTNLVPAFYELDDYQVRTPTDVIGQHIHLPKWDLTSADGSANGWNYEDGVLSPVAVVERIQAIRAFNRCTAGDPRDGTPVDHRVGEPALHRGPRAHPVGTPELAEIRVRQGLRTNTHDVDRGLGNIFTHDHLGPSTHQQVGLYATVLTEPAGSSWYHAETGEPLYTRADGGPTSWQAVIATGDYDGDGKNDSFREFFLEYSDFQHAYEAGVYVGAGPDGVPDPAAYPATVETFRQAINPPVRRNASTLLEAVVELAGGQAPGCPARPCPQAISVDDPGIFVVNYRHEPLALRVFDPNRRGPDGKPGMQAEGLAGDLAHALQSRTDRIIAPLNLAPSAIREAEGPAGSTAFPPHVNVAGDLPGDPFTPLLRSYSGDNVRLRMHAGGHEEVHNVTLHGVKWLQNGTGYGSGYGRSPNSGWKAAQMVSISEQFGFVAPVSMMSSAIAETGDYLYSINASLEGYWNGLWGVMRNYTVSRGDLYALPNNPRPVAARNTAAFDGVCPRVSPNPTGNGNRPTPLRSYEIVAALANDILGNPLGLTIGDPQGAGQHVGAPLNPAGGTLVFNPRATTIAQTTVVDEETGESETLGGQSGPLHDPTAILYVHKADLDPNTGKLKAGVPVEPLVLRAAAGDCIDITLENRLPEQMPDLPTYAILPGTAKRDRAGAEGSTTFNNNLLRPSSHVGLHAQLLSYDVTQSDGFNVGINPEQTVPPRVAGGAYPSRTYRFYAGHLEREGKPSENGQRNLDKIDATAVEFGGLNLLPADPIKQGQKGLGGAMSVLPLASTWTTDAAMRAAATVTQSGQADYRDFSLVWQKGLNLRWANGRPVENMAAEGFGVPVDSEDNSGMAINYKSEPLWYRFAQAPDAPFGHGGWGDLANVHMAYANDLVNGDPVTPVLTASPGQPLRVHVTMPSGGSRGATFQLDGHLFPQEPFLAQYTENGYPAKDAGIGSVRFGLNPLTRHAGAQESVLPAAHFNFLYPSAGGGNAVPGDYLYRDQAAFGNAGGLWGLLRVQQQGSQTATGTQTNGNGNGKVK
ncbi:hypothetical protein SAMN04244573_00192 [Azotobacter beijerinckii]|uniref:Multicopper oxidase n=1 Tax=Azotobacter beijerinckii TaxID=170623 RepID=A0A1H8ZCE6_9GAMM|nr:manganese-oxidizing multicopper oxidase MnxG [Azotobacter beijerinckii]SEP61847.1 hypothetical protein SAMN04244573_00192 [Azotobacter beijerinckii]